MSQNGGGKVWSEQAVWTLLSIYEDKWRQVEWGNLKARHWEEVATTFAAAGGLRCLPKSPLQCKNKVEDLKKKFKEKMHKGSSSSSSKWPYFARMDAMFASAARGLIAQEGAAAAATATATAAAYNGDFGSARHHHFSSLDDTNTEVNGDEFDEDGGNESHRGGGGDGNHNEFEEEDEDAEGEEEDEEEEVEEELSNFDAGLKRKPRALANRRKKTRCGGGSMRRCGSSWLAKDALVALVASLGESVVRIERSKLESQRQLLLMRAQAENRRIEMEAKSHDMFITLQLQLAQLIAQRDHI
ncbi:trihelix transcription factor ASIL2-like [Selaginella moellendorffii]|uniref:trihelix transcription factor ASIL2-like n=1 Tax=Selaginella moellendorffii TaxID=88036 RepID=UPI000D1D002D|nr:trihelix transcription factor ASIL2-like [Selaginella moellendorffii]|eukprot:XP_024544222.1 trihelix transcription factor ASIL2-like [Selaginella moellendorffii]